MRIRTTFSRPLRVLLLPVLAWSLMLVASAVDAQKPSEPGSTAAKNSVPPDLSGGYGSRATSAEIAVIASGDRIWFTYDDSGPEGGSWACIVVAEGEQTGPDTYKLNGQGDITLTFRKGVLAIENKGVVEDCGISWIGFEESYKRTQGLRECRVKAARSWFLDAARKRTKSYVVAGDRVKVVVGDRTGNLDSVLARFGGPKAATVGLLMYADLVCPKR
jgi:hypothetical protein